MRCSLASVRCLRVAGPLITLWRSGLWRTGRFITSSWHTGGSSVNLTPGNMTSTSANHSQYSRSWLVINFFPKYRIYWNILPDSGIGVRLRVRKRWSEAICGIKIHNAGWRPWQFKTGEVGHLEFFLLSVSTRTSSVWCWMLKYELRRETRCLISWSQDDAKESNKKTVDQRGWL